MKRNNAPVEVDALIIATHPDDAEATCGGTITKLVTRGARVGVLDASRGEMGTRGTVEDRDAECKAATRKLKLAWRENLGLPDGRIVNSVEARESIAEILRKLRPRLLFAPWWKSDLHPDHVAVGILARQAFFLSGLRRLAPLNNPHRPSRVYYYPSHDIFDPDFVVALDESEFDRKLEALRCYGSQFRPSTKKDRGQHFVHGQDLAERIALRARYFGVQAGSPFGEPFKSEQMLTDRDPLEFKI